MKLTFATASLALPAALIVVSLSIQSPRTAYACSVGDDWNPVAESTVIVGGRITGWSERPDLGTLGMYSAITFNLQVDQVYKGRVAKSLLVVDGNSYVPQLRSWQGTGGACGTFSSEPSGLYVIVGLGIREDGHYASSGPLTFFLGDSPSGESYEASLQRLKGYAAIAPPGTGSGGLLKAVSER